MSISFSFRSSSLYFSSLSDFLEPAADAFGYLVSMFLLNRSAVLPLGSVAAANISAVWLPKPPYD